MYQERFIYLYLMNITKLLIQGAVRNIIGLIALETPYSLTQNIRKIGKFKNKYEVFGCFGVSRFLILNPYFHLFFG
ncbi:hypothetical protein SAMD00079811_41990 [Scytonema sp. HK-05]|nr:hypothetical protein NIES2130_34260 [Scytonema sp. HK-05]BAY46586.1 hypothetical protein SAMD00079811_41990 [Scytonema sp. HK-05]